MGFTGSVDQIYPEHPDSPKRIFHCIRILDFLYIELICFRNVEPEIGIWNFSLFFAYDLGREEPDSA